MGEISEVVHFLLDYPIKTEPYPENYPEDLIYDPYPGKDFVIGFCDDAVEQFVRIAGSRKEIEELAIGFADIFKEVRRRRLVKLQPKVESPPKQDGIKQLEMWLNDNPNHPDYEEKLKQLEMMYDDPWIQSVLELLVY
jgi:hypothetical protein